MLCKPESQFSSANTEIVKCINKKDAEDCIKLYNWIRENYEGEVWESDWTAIAKAKWIGKYPNFKLIHTPTLIGYTLLKAIENKN